MHSASSSQYLSMLQLNESNVPHVALIKCHPFFSEAAKENKSMLQMHSHTSRVYIYFFGANTYLAE